MQQEYGAGMRRPSERTLWLATTALTALVAVSSLVAVKYTSDLEANARAGTRQAMQSIQNETALYDQQHQAGTLTEPFFNAQQQTSAQQLAQLAKGL